MLYYIEADVAVAAAELPLLVALTHFLRFLLLVSLGHHLRTRRISNSSLPTMMVMLVVLLLLLLIRLVVKVMAFLYSCRPKTKTLKWVHVGLRRCEV